jgi:hypothetical protein
MKLDFRGIIELRIKIQMSLVKEVGQEARARNNGLSQLICVPYLLVHLVSLPVGLRPLLASAKPFSSFSSALS